VIAKASAPLNAKLRAGERLGDRVLRVDHAGEHGAVCIYLAQRLVARWRAPDLVEELTEFLEHERRHRALFAAELKKRGIHRCRSYWLGALSGSILGFATGLVGRDAIAATTVAIESVVLSHLEEQIIVLENDDPDVVRILRDIIEDERAHREDSANRLGPNGVWQRFLNRVVSRATELVIWVGMAT
jgi:3-demethoxyubiquinol 3-hydroxylase